VCQSVAECSKLSLKAGPVGSSLLWGEIDSRLFIGSSLDETVPSRAGSGRHVLDAQGQPELLSLSLSSFHVLLAFLHTSLSSHSPLGNGRSEESSSGRRFVGQGTGGTGSERVKGKDTRGVHP
jgi:hypothetical protein